jgi:hypothetical protein
VDSCDFWMPSIGNSHLFGSGTIFSSLAGLFLTTLGFLPQWCLCDLGMVGSSLKRRRDFCPPCHGLMRVWDASLNNLAPGLFQAVRWELILCEAPWLPASPILSSTLQPVAMVWFGFSQSAWAGSP